MSVNLSSDSAHYAPLERWGAFPSGFQADPIDKITDGRRGFGMIGNTLDWPDPWQASSFSEALMSLSSLMFD